jgi:hypothetical protein
MSVGLFPAKASQNAVDNRIMDRKQANAILESSCAAAQAIVAAQLGRFDPTDLACGAAYDAILFPLLADYAGEMTLGDFFSLLE